MKNLTTIQGDTWDILAKRAYGDEKLMNELIAANPGYRKAVIFSAGTVLTVPEVEISRPSSTPPWRR